MQFIVTKDAPEASGHYSQAVVANGFVFVAGQLPLDPVSRAVPPEAASQARLALANVRSILEAAGSSLDKIVTATVFVTDIELWPAINAVWGEVFGNHRPARAIAVSPDLHFGCQIEVQVTAVA